MKAINSKLFWIIGLIAVPIVNCLAQTPKPIDVGGVPFHPYRKVGASFYDLNPIYEWSKILNVPGNKITPKQRATRRPMSDWIGMTDVISSQYEGFTAYKVQQVVQDGMLLRKENHGPREIHSTVFFLTNYPWLSSISEEQQIKFLALKTGVYKYTDASGASRTVEMFDYGTPHNPRVLAQHSKTNLQEVTTNAPTKSK